MNYKSNHIVALSSANTNLRKKCMPTTTRCVRHSTVESAVRCEQNFRESTSSSCVRKRVVGKEKWGSGGVAEADSEMWSDEHEDWVGMRVDSAFDVLRRRMCFPGLVVIHDPVMFGLNEMLEVSFDGLDRVLLADKIWRLLCDHDLRSVRIAGHWARDDWRVGHTQTLDSSHAETFSKSTTRQHGQVAASTPASPQSVLRKLHLFILILILFIKSKRTKRPLTLQYGYIQTYNKIK